MTFNWNTDEVFAYSGDTLNYYVESGDELVFSGTARRSPKDTHIRINLRKIAEDWLEMEFRDFLPMNGESYHHEGAYRTFQLYDKSNDSLLYEFACVIGEIGGEDSGLINDPVDGKADSRQKLFFTFFGNWSGDTTQDIDVHGEDIYYFHCRESMTITWNAQYALIPVETNMPLDEIGFILPEGVGYVNRSYTGFGFSIPINHNEVDSETYTIQFTRNGEVLGSTLVIVSAEHIFFECDSSIRLPHVGGTFTVHYESNFGDDMLTAVGSSGLTLVSLGNGSAVFSYPENPDPDIAENYTVDFYYDGQALVGECYATAVRGPYFIIQPSFNIYAWEDGLIVTGETNVSDYVLVCNDEWLSIRNRSYDSANNRATIDIRTGFGDPINPRTGTITVMKGLDVLATFSITQSELDTGGAIIGISDIPDTYYLRGEDRGNWNIPADYSGVTFFGNVFPSSGSPSDNKGYVSTPSGIISHIGALGSTSIDASAYPGNGAYFERYSDLFKSHTREYWESQGKNPDYHPWCAEEGPGKMSAWGGRYHTLIVPKGCTAINTGYTVYYYADNKIEAYHPDEPVPPDWAGWDTTIWATGYDPPHSIPGGASYLQKVYWNAVLPIPDYFCCNTGFESNRNIERFQTRLKYLHSNSTEIGIYAFAKTPLETIELPSGSTIGAYAFSGCTSLEDLTPSDLSGITIETGAFTGAHLSLPVLRAAVVYDNAFKETVLDNPSGNLLIEGGDYHDYGGQFAYATGITGTITTSGVTNLGTRMFEGTEVRNVVSDAVNAEGKAMITVFRLGAFAYCHNLVSVDMPELKHASGGTFYECDSLTSVNLPKLETTDRTIFTGDTFDYYFGMFTNCSALQTLSLPSIQRISEYTFKDCTSLSRLTLGPDLAYIGVGAFSGCTSLSAITYQNNHSHYDNVGTQSYWNSNSVLKKVICTDGDAYHTWWGDAFTFIDRTLFNAQTSMTTYRSDSSFYPVNNMYDGKAMFQTFTVNATNVFVDIPYSFSDALRTLTVNATKLQVNSFNYPNTLINPDVYDSSQLVDITLNVTNEIGLADMDECDIKSLTIADSPTLTKIAIAGGTLPYKLEELTFQGTKAKWTSVAQLWQGFYNSSTFTVHCTDGDIVYS